MEEWTGKVDEQRVEVRASRRSCSGRRRSSRAGECRSVTEGWWSEWRTEAVACVPQAGIPFRIRERGERRR